MCSNKLLFDHINNNSATYSNSFNDLPKQEKTFYQLDIWFVPPSVFIWITSRSVLKTLVDPSGYPHIANFLHV
ncbi:hypothetical protein HZS_3349 [Henneguya salminicola]|nr:hypothetical protein HZS_3349 [Henneguya salminicola]